MSRGDCYRTAPKWICSSCFVSLCISASANTPCTGWTYWNGNKPKRKLFSQLAAVTYLHLSIMPAYHNVQFCSNAYGTVLFYSNQTFRWEIDVDWRCCVLRLYKYKCCMNIMGYINFFIHSKTVISVRCQYWRRNRSKIMVFMVTMGARGSVVVNAENKNHQSKNAFSHQ
jgi:hypothetical protein